MTPVLSAADADFHLYLLVGQSNMAGRGKVEKTDVATDPRIVAFSKERTWVPAQDPLHFDKPEAGVGPGLAFAQAIARQQPGIRIGLIPCAVGGTAIERWAAGAADPATKTHPYDDMLARARAALPAGVLKGILWHQGEANRKDAAYPAKLTELVARMREDLQAPQVPFIAGELRSFRPDADEATVAFNQGLHGLAERIPRFAVVSADGLADKGDKLHFDSASARILGGRYAEAMLRLQAAR
jgi:hypothetical protein